MLYLTIENTYETYRIGNNLLFFVEIVTSEKLYEAWLCNDEIGIKKYMFGIFREDCTKHKFLEMVDSEVDNYITYFYDN